ncbi:MAG: hypothetical protein PHT94_03135 [Candidatus Nanoarchaeia archaeon]|nr:hypothetical protein [Candidatus Nanoarchaeia archaeon]
MEYNKYDISNLFIISFLLIFTIFVFLYQISNDNFSNNYDKFKDININTNSNKYSNEKSQMTNEELIDDTKKNLEEVIKDLEDDSPMNILKNIKIEDVKFSYYSPYGKYTPEIEDKIVDIKRDLFYVYIVIKDLSLEDSYHKFELYSNFYTPNGEIIDYLSQKIGIFQGSNYIYNNQRVISIPISIKDKVEGIYPYNIYVIDLISNKKSIYEGTFNIIDFSNI